MDILILSLLVNRLFKCLGWGKEEGEGKRKKGERGICIYLVISVGVFFRINMLIKYLWILMYWFVKFGNIF